MDLEALLHFDLYKTLGVSKNATLPEIRRAYKKLVLICHPDKIQDASLKPVKQVEFQKLQEAYEILSDVNKRHQYDDFLKKVEIRKQMSQGKPTPRSNPFEYQVKTPGTQSGSFTSNGNVHMFHSTFNGATWEPRKPRAPKAPPSPRKPFSASFSTGPEIRQSSRNEDMKMEVPKKAKQEVPKKAKEEVPKKAKEEVPKKAKEEVPKKAKDDETIRNRRKQKEDEVKEDETVRNRRKQKEEEAKRKKRMEDEAKENRRKQKEDEVKRKQDRKKGKERKEKEKERKQGADEVRSRKINAHVEDGSDEEYRSPRLSGKKQAQSNSEGHQSARNPTKKVPLNKKWTEHQDRAGAYLNASLKNSAGPEAPKKSSSGPSTPLPGRKPSLKTQKSAPPLLHSLSSRRKPRESSSHANGSPSLQRSQTYSESRSPPAFDLSPFSYLSIPENLHVARYSNTLTRSHCFSERTNMIAPYGQSLDTQRVLLSSGNIRTLTMNVTYSPQLNQDQVNFATHSHSMNPGYR